MIGLFCTLIPGLTALRLKLVRSKSSSLLLLLFTFLVISAAVGPIDSCGVADLEGDEFGIVGVDSEELSNDISSLIPDEEPRGKNAGGGGGVCTLSLSLKPSQNSFPFELRIACALKLLERVVDISVIISSSGIPSNESWVIGPMLGDECVVVVVDRDTEGCRNVSKSISLSRVSRTTSASRRTSVSIGVLSSARAALIRANPFVLGYTRLAETF